MLALRTPTLNRLVSATRLTPRWCRLFSSTSPTFSTAPAPTPPNPNKHYYVTTPIFYVNAAPHIGHLHSQLLADVFARFNRLRHPTAPEPVMLTGTDEHGLKIQRVAEAQGVTPIALCDRVSQTFLKLADAANVDYSIFMRTTEERHRVAVEHVWRQLRDKGLMYKSSYAGWYAVSDEAYYPAAQVGEVIDDKTGEKYMASLETGTRVEWMEEENYKFKLSAFREPLIGWLSQEPSPLQPPSRAAALLTSLSTADSSDLADLSISRPASRLAWGIPVPDDPDHTIYVWIDALVNYLTGAGYPWTQPPTSSTTLSHSPHFTEGQVWPPNLMIIGKDIIRFHALYLPAVLMALDLPLPTALLAHGHWTMDKFKMSKSRGNVANPFDAMDLWGVDPVRAFLMRAGGNSASDADYSAAEVDKFYRKDLAGQMGNLLSRLSAKKLIARLPSPDALYTQPATVTSDDAKLLELLSSLSVQFDHHMSTFEVQKALAAAFDVLTEANKHLQLISPWLATATAEEVHRGLFYASEALRMVGIVLGPVMPEKSSELLDGLGVGEGRRGWAELVVGGGGERAMKVGKKGHLFGQLKEREEAKP